MVYTMPSSGPVHTAGGAVPGRRHVTSRSGDATACGPEEGSTEDLAAHWGMWASSPEGKCWESAGLLSLSSLGLLAPLLTARCAGCLFSAGGKDRKGLPIIGPPAQGLSAWPHTATQTTWPALIMAGEGATGQYLHCREMFPAEMTPTSRPRCWVMPSPS